MRKQPLYLDHNATTPVDTKVLEAMLPYFSEHFGNPASKTHSYGWAAEAAVEKAREQVAGLIGATAREIIFTSGATESDNLAVAGVAEAYREKGNHIITTAIEHKAVLDTCKNLRTRGYEITIIEPDSQGLIDPQDIRKAITKNTTLISIIWANNEIGTVQPLAEIGKIAKEHDVIFHTDAVQGMALLDFDVEAMGVDLVSITGHKMYGPKGCGALFVRRKNPRVEVRPLIFGGGHERGLRSGTLNVPGIVGLGAAAELAKTRRTDDGSRLCQLRDRMIASLSRGIEGFRLNGHPTRRLPGNIHFSVAGLNGEALLAELKDIAVSASSACLSDGTFGSHVLEAIKVPETFRSCSVRMGLGRSTRVEDGDFAANLMISAAERLRQQAPR